MKDYITIRQAATIAGYSNAGTLHAAARAGRLETAAVGGVRFTTRAWLDAYLSSVKPRGIARGGARDGDS